MQYKRKSSTASYGWKSIQKGKELLQQGLRRSLANGQNTNFWDDHWLPVNPPRKVSQLNVRPPMKVSEFIDHQTMTWRVDKLSQFLPPEEVALASSIRLTKYAAQDQYVWPFTTNMEYNVKSGYRVPTHVFLQDEAIQQPEGSLVLKKQFWKLKILPKIKQFLWKCSSGDLPTLVHLCSRGIKIDPVCQRCCMEEETIAHALFLCPHAQAIWRCSGFSSTDMFSDNLQENLTILFELSNASNTTKSASKLPFWIIWFIWKSRNEFLFPKRNVHPIDESK